VSPNHTSSRFSLSYLYLSLRLKENREKEKKEKQQKETFLKSNKKETALQLQHVPEEEEETKPEESQGAKQTHRSSMHGHGKLATIDDDGIQRAARRRCWLVTWAALMVQLNSVGSAQRPTRTHPPPHGHPLKRTSTFAASTPSLTNQFTAAQPHHVCNMHP